MSFAPRFTVTNSVTAALTRIERARGFLEAAKLSEDWIRDMGERALVLEAHHTTHIEGTRLTLEQAERLLAGEAVPEADPDDVRELLNYRNAFEFVSGYLGDGGPITEGLVRVMEHGRLAIQDFEALCPSVHRRTLQRDLKGLVERGLLRAEGATNRAQYVAGEALR